MQIIVTTNLSLNEFVKACYYLTYKRWFIRFITFIGWSSIILWIANFADIRGLIFGIIFAIGVPFVLYISFRKNYFSNNNRISEDITYTFDNESINIKGKTFNSSFTWDNIYMVAESKRWLLLYQNKYAVNIIPKDKILKEDIEALKSIIMNYKSVKNKFK